MDESRNMCFRVPVYFVNQNIGRISSHDKFSPVLIIQPAAVFSIYVMRSTLPNTDLAIAEKDVATLNVFVSM